MRFRYRHVSVAGNPQNRSDILKNGGGYAVSPFGTTIPEELKQNDQFGG